PFWRQRLSLGLAAGVYGARDTLPGAGEDLMLTLVAAPLLAQVVLHVPIGRFALRLAGGGGASIVHTRLESAGVGTSTATRAVGGAWIAVGGEVAAGSGRVGIELAYWYTPLGDGALSGNAGGLSASLGYRFDLSAGSTRDGGGASPAPPAPPPPPPRRPAPDGR